MKKIKRGLGIIWILIGLFSGYYLIISQAVPFFLSDKPEDLVPAIIYAFVLAPIIAGGLVIFGWYVLKGEYDVK
jgi:hypothetical protein